MNFHPPRPVFELLKLTFLLLVALSFRLAVFILVHGVLVGAHNQYAFRQELLQARGPSTDHASAHLGLTQKELASCDEYVARAYRNAVMDGYRLGMGYRVLSSLGLVLCILLFVAGTLGLRVLRRPGQHTGQKERFVSEASAG